MAASEATQALARAGFGASEMEQERFVSRIASGRTARAELSNSRGFLHLSATLVAGAFAVLLISRGQQPDAIAAGAAALGHAVLGVRARKSQQQLGREDAPAEADACYEAKDGLLHPALGPDEKILFAFEADGKERKLLRFISGNAFMLWGLLLGGLSFTMFSGNESAVAVLVNAVACFVGSAISGRGMRTLVATESVKRFVVTNERTVAMVAPGAAWSISHSALRHRPVVVARPNHRATLALAIRPLPSASPLPFMSLVGVHDISENEAKKIAGTVMEARRTLLERIS